MSKNKIINKLKLIILFIPRVIFTIISIIGCIFFFTALFISEIICKIKFKIKKS